MIQKSDELGSPSEAHSDSAHDPSSNGKPMPNEAGEWHKKANRPEARKKFVARKYAAIEASQPLIKQLKTIKRIIHTKLGNPS